MITLATDWKSVSAGTWHTCAVRATTKLYCWGDDYGGKLGNGGGVGPNKSTPQLITLP